MSNVTSTAISELQTEVIPAIGTARLVAEPALREAMLILDALAGQISQSDEETAATVRQVIADLEVGNRIDRPCCNNPWRAKLNATKAATVQPATDQH